MTEKTTEELIAEAKWLLAQERANRGRGKRFTRGLLILIALFFVLLIGSAFIYGIFQGFTSHETSSSETENPILVQKYCRGDIIGYNASDDIQCIVLEYDEELDEYKSRLVWKIEDRWLYSSENDTSIWNERETLEWYYPIKIDHITDFSMLISFDEYWEQEQERLLNDSIKKIPRLANCYSKIKSKETLMSELKLLDLPSYYQANISDCSEMSAYLEWWLESHGIHAYIIEGEVLPNPEIFSGGGPHAWVEAEITGENISIESTGKFFPRIFTDDSYYEEENRFENLEELMRYYYKEGYDIQSVYDEYNWWDVLPKKFLYIN